MTPLIDVLAIERSALFGIQTLLVLTETYFTTYVRPLLEYNTYIWSPHEVHNVTKIESVQRRFTKCIPFVSHLSYGERLEFLGLESLEYRRLIADLTMMYEIVHYLVDVDRNALITFNSTYVARNSLLKLYKQSSLSSVRAQVLRMRCINGWNYLPEQARSSTSVSAFKKSVYLQLKIYIRFITVFLIQDNASVFSL